MPYLIDTNWVVYHLADIPEAAELLERLAPQGIAISIITYMEAYQGAERSEQPEHAQARLHAFLETVPILEFTIPVAQRCARLREMLRRQGRRVRPRDLDLIIAATAIEQQLTLVTRNIDDYKDIADLTLYEESQRGDQT